MNYSLTLSGAIAMLLAFLAQSLGIEIPYTTEQVTTAVVTVVGLLGFVITYLGRVRQGDITWYGKKV